jgi:hypothetical protein
VQCEEQEMLDGQAAMHSADSCGMLSGCVVLAPDYQITLQGSPGPGVSHCQLFQFF